MTDYGQATLKMVAELMDEGAHHLSLLMRHSARTYDPDLPEDWERIAAVIAEWEAL